MSKNDITKFEYYAGQALAGLAANPNFCFDTPVVELETEHIAKVAWILALKLMASHPSQHSKRRFIQKEA